MGKFIWQLISGYNDVTINSINAQIHCVDKHIDVTQFYTIYFEVLLTSAVSSTTMTSIFNDYENKNNKIYKEIIQ